MTETSVLHLAFFKVFRPLSRTGAEKSPKVPVLYSPLFRGGESENDS
jgi:hypothetical protein